MHEPETGASPDDPPVRPAADALPPPLAYRAPRDDQLERSSVPYWVQVAAGFGSSLLIVLIGFPIRIVYGGLVGRLAFSLIAVSLLSIYLNKRYRWRGFAVGVLLMWGLTALAVGTCVAVFSFG